MFQDNPTELVPDFSHELLQY